MILPDLLRERSGEDPGAVQLRVGRDELLTAADWESQSNAVARGLVARGVAAGDRVALAISNARWLDYAVSYLAVLKAGAVAVPLGERFTDSEREAVVVHSGATLVVGDGETAALADGQATERFQVPVGGDDLAEIIYTSGTTGMPKGVACRHANLMAHDLPADAAAVGRGETARRVSFLHAFPVGTQAAQEALRVPLRVAGRTAVAMPTFDPGELCALVAHHRVVRLQLVPAMAQLLVASGAPRGHDLSSVRRVILSSAPAAPALFARLGEVFGGAELWNAYALTEAGAARTLLRWDPARPAAVGYPVGQTEVRVDNTGEIWLRRAGSPTRSYYRDPAATAEVFVDGWVRTGDAGSLDSDGCLHLVGRVKDLVITGGVNVSPVEVENVLYEHPAVLDAAVIGVPHPVLGEDVAAAVVVRAPTPVRELQDWVRARLAEHKVPHRIVVVDLLPRNASGKVVKAELRAEFAKAEPTGEGFVGPRNAGESIVVSVWEAVLATGAVGVHDDFFALGGHSLAAAQIAARLADAFGVDVPATAVFEHPTVAELAAAIAAMPEPLG